MKTALQKDIRDAVIKVCTEKELNVPLVIKNNQTEIWIGNNDVSTTFHLLLKSEQKTWTTSKRYTTPRAGGTKVALNPKARYIVTVKLKTDSKEVSRKRVHSESSLPNPSSSVPAKKKCDDTKCSVM